MIGFVVLSSAVVFLFMLIIGIIFHLSCRACDALRSCLPDMLKDATFASCLRVSFLSFSFVIIFVILSSVISYLLG